MYSTWRKTVCQMLMLLMAWMPFHVAHAGVISTDQVVTTTSQTDRAAVMSVVTRGDVANQLQALGIDLATANDRVAAMTDVEVRNLASQLHALPAGAASGWVILAVVLLVWWLWK